MASDGKYTVWMGCNRAVIVSDLHLGAPGGALTVFRQHAALVNLVNSLRDGETELILAGDVFDFIAYPGYERLDRAQAIPRLRAMCGVDGSGNLDGNSANGKVLQALRDFISIDGNMLTVLAGNHDPELLLPDVQVELARLLGTSRDKLLFDELLTRPGEAQPLWGRALADASGRTLMWVVHGDCFQPINRIDRNAILAGETPEDPHGSALVHQLLARLPMKAEWVYTLKEDPAVLALLFLLNHSATNAWLDAAQGIKGRQFVRAYVSSEIRSGLGVLSSHGNAPEEPESVDPEYYRSLLARTVGCALDDAKIFDPDSRLAAVDKLWDQVAELARLPPDERLRELSPPLEAALPTLHLLGYLPRVLWRFVAKLAQWEASRIWKFDTDSDLGITSAQRIRLGGVAGIPRTIVFGHTHWPRNWVDPATKRRFVNSGTWIPLARLIPGDIDALVSARAKFIEEEDPCTFVEADLKARRLRLQRWKENQPDDVQGWCSLLE